MVNVNAVAIKPREAKREKFMMVSSSGMLLGQ